MKALVTLFFLILSFVSIGQRKIDLSVELTNPKDNDIITAFIAVPISIKLTNLGPDTLKVNDTIWYNTSNIPVFTYHQYVLTSDVEPGSFVNIQLSELKNLNSGENDSEIDFCVKVVHKDLVPGMSGGDFVDTAIANNTDCSKIIIKSTSTNEISNFNQIKLYPNPASDNIFLSLPAINQSVNVVIYNATGIIIDNIKLPAKDAATTYSIDINNYQAGVYLIKVFGEQQAVKNIVFTKI